MFLECCYNVISDQIITKWQCCACCVGSFRIWNRQSSVQKNHVLLVFIERAKQCLIKVLLFRCRCRRPSKMCQIVAIEKFIRWLMLNFCFLYDTSLKLAILIYFVILRNISRRFFFKKFNIFWVIAARIVPKSGDRKICEVAC